MRNRLSWDDYFMIQALWARVRSLDESTRCGCILVDKKNRPMGQGYNGHPRKVNYDDMPQNRPEKYGPIIHSENNAILNCVGLLEEFTAYITGPPCIHCWSQLIQAGVKRVVFGPITTSKDGLYKNINTDNLHPTIQNMLKSHNIEVVKWKPKNMSLITEELKNIIHIIEPAISQKGSE
jgi:dCMP deaminase